MKLWTLTDANVYMYARKESLGNLVYRNKCYDFTSTYKKMTT